jgi:hypothetical protein
VRNEAGGELDESMILLGRWLVEASLTCLATKREDKRRRRRAAAAAEEGGAKNGKSFLESYARRASE